MEEKQDNLLKLSQAFEDSFHRIKDKTISFWQMGNPKYRVLLLIGIIGLVLIFLSGTSKEKSTIPTDEELICKQEEIQEYILFTEKRLEQIIEQIENAGECSVMITLKQGRENIYASEGKTVKEVSQEPSTRDLGRAQEKSSDETKLVMIKNRNGSGEPLLKKTLEPQINGVVVVCKGAQSAKVRQQVTEAVTTVLGIRSTQVCVSPRSRFK